MTGCEVVCICVYVFMYKLSNQCVDDDDFVDGWILQVCRQRHGNWGGNVCA